ncbi:MAG TPA: hypothetical protein DFR83_15145 [Deltaproteobacteria bacterium]|nr:hypothetical protein [Deltaproteobacteria bacterium]
MSTRIQPVARSLWRSAGAVVVASVACTNPDGMGTGKVLFEDRVAGERSTRTASCDALDEGRCLLPFPSSAFMVEDPDSPTGRRVFIEDASLPGTGEDEAGFINLMDGFSRLSPVLSTFAEGLDPALTAGRMHGPAHDSSPVHLVNAEPDHPDYGTEIPVWLEIVDNGFEGGPDLLIAFPTIPMAENAEYVVFITDEVLDSSGHPVVADRMADVALGRVEPSSEEEARIASHHAPARALLAERTDLDPERVVRVWDFSTRTTVDVTRRLDSMMADAVGAMDAVEVELLTFTPREDPAIAAIVKGELRGVPDFLTDARRFEYDADGLPIAQGTRTTSFRVTLPAEGFDGPGSDYRVALYGHGTGGDVNDNSFDSEIAAEGVVKVNLEFHGWTGDDLVYTFVDLLTLMRGSEQSTSQLLQAVVDGYALLKALEGELGSQLRAETIAGEPNPLAGTGPITDDPAWVGGSLGGTMGAIISAAYPEIDKAVLNVPAGAWTHLVADSYMYTGALRGILAEAYGTEIDARFAMAIMQTSWDDVDGAAWADRARADGVKLLLQQSMDDPVVPNQGTDLLAAALQAEQVGPALRPIAAVEPSEDDLVIDGVGITQYRVPDEGPFQVHGFAARNTPAGLAAMEQIFGFMRSGWAGEARIHFPDGCADVTADGSCDFSEHW